MLQKIEGGKYRTDGPLPTIAKSIYQFLIKENVILSHKLYYFTCIFEGRAYSNFHGAKKKNGSSNIPNIIHGCEKSFHFEL